MAKGGYLCHQGEFFKKDHQAFESNRAFLYGDGVFETMRAKGEHIHLLELHFERLRKSLDLIRIEYSPELFREINLAITELIRRNNHEDGARLRLTVYRMSEGKYLPKANRAAYLIQSEDLNHADYTLNQKGLRIELTDEFRVHPSPFTGLKTIGSQLYIQAALECDRRGFDELLLLNHRGEVAEGTHANLFMRLGKEVITPTLASGCLAGVMRAQVINLLQGSNYQLSQRELRPEELMSADEVFLTDSISGVRWVGSYRQKRYFNDLSKRLIELLNKEL